MEPYFKETGNRIPRAGRCSRVRGETAEQTDSRKPDTDGDGVLDGQEVYGYKITVLRYEGKDLRSKDLVVKGCPRTTGAYKAADCSTLLDVDGDGITDRGEINPWNPDAAKGVRDFRTQHGTNKTMMDNAFNPFLKETMPPVILRATAQSHVEWGWFGVKRAWTTVYVEAVDVVPVRFSRRPQHLRVARSSLREGIRKG
ncbi:MAG TPA: hypothetical protein VI915_04205 [Thermoplasmata archaeon]|nr:hypothetical protein [Thermoplasmata archaeon]